MGATAGGRSGMAQIVATPYRDRYAAVTPKVVDLISAFNPIPHPPLIPTFFPIDLSVSQLLVNQNFQHALRRKVELHPRSLSALIQRNCAIRSFLPHTSVFCAILVRSFPSCISRFSYDGVCSEPLRHIRHG